MSGISGSSTLSSTSSPTRAVPASIRRASYAVTRARLLACRARGAIRIHSSSRASVRWRAASAFSSWASRACFCPSQEE